MIAHPLPSVQGWRWSLVLAAALTGAPWGLTAPALADEPPRKPDAVQDRLRAARAARRAGNWAEAERRLKECERLNGPVGAVALERKLLAAQRGDVADVEKGLIAAVQQNHPDSVLILEALAQGYHEACRLGDEDRTLREWLERKPGDTQVLYRLGRVIEQRARASARGWDRGPHQRAREFYRRAVEADPKHDAARLRLAEGFLEQSRADEALEHFRRLRQRRPKDPAPLLGLARCEILLGRTEEGTKLLDQLLADHPRHALALRERGKVALQEGQAEQAEKWLRQAATLAPGDNQTAYILFNCLRLADKREEAAAALARFKSVEEDQERLNKCLEAAERAPQDPAPRSEAGAILLKLGEEEEGLRWLRSALRADPKYRAAHRALADYYQRKGDKERAEKHRKLAE
jgi:tetratricopeptide (TPR) repeat protein